MNDELVKVLKMIQDGILTADQGTELLEAMGLHEKKSAEQPARKHLIRVIALSATGDKVNIRLPIKLLRAGKDFSHYFSKATNQQKNHLNDIDWNELLSIVDQMIENNTTGEIVQVRSADGGKVVIMLE